MILDKEQLFSDAQAITTTANSTNVIDLLKDRDIGVGHPVGVLIQVVTTMTAAGAATLTVTIETDDNASFSSATVLYTSGAIAVADLIAGKRPWLLWFGANNERYIRLVYTVATGPMTAGAVTAGLIEGFQNWQAYADSLPAL